MFLNNNSLDKKRRLLVLIGALITGLCIPAGGVLAFEEMLKLGQTENPIVSSNEPAP